MKQGKKNINKASRTKIELAYRFIEFVPGLGGLVRKGGILMKWTALISMITVMIVSLLSIIFTLMSTSVLMSSTRQLCQTIVGNISSAESIITAERSTFKRSVILPDLVSGLSNSNIKGFEYAAVYDTSGNLVEKKMAYAAHTESMKRATPVPTELYNEIL